MASKTFAVRGRFSGRGDKSKIRREGLVSFEEGKTIIWLEEMNVLDRPPAQMTITTNMYVDRKFLPKIGKTFYKLEEVTLKDVTVQNMVPKNVPEKQSEVIISADDEDSDEVTEDEPEELEDEPASEKKAAKAVDTSDEPEETIEDEEFEEEVD